MFSNIREIFTLYGGWKSLRSSSYVFWALLVSLALWRDAVTGDWAENAESYLPPILGFSFAALAIMTAIGDDQFRQRMAKVDVINSGESDLSTITANFCWFIVVQIAVVLISMVFKSRPIPYICGLNRYQYSCNHIVEWGNVGIGLFSNFLIVYSLMLIIAAISQMMNIFRVYLRSLPKD